MLLTASNRKTLIRLASEFPKGSVERKSILAGLEKTAWGMNESDYMAALGKIREAISDISDLVDAVGDSEFESAFYDLLTQYKRKNPSSSMPFKLAGVVVDDDVAELVLE